MMKSFSGCCLLEKWEDTTMSITWKLETASEKQISICASLSLSPPFLLTPRTIRQYVTKF